MPDYVNSKDKLNPPARSVPLTIMHAPTLCEVAQLLLGTNHASSHITFT